MDLLDTDWLESAKGKRWIIGVSGGRDSVALLHACIAAGITELLVVHINHSLRGKESDQDAELVRELAAYYKLSCVVTEFPVGALAAREKKSLELCARETRHEVFSAESERWKCEGVLLAHHADDQAETILFNLLRGSAGLRGMQKRQVIENVGIILYRPLLGTTRAEIDAYITEHELKYREDSSNADDFATRNRIRNEAMPLLENIMGRKVTPTLTRALSISEKKNALLDEMIDYESLIDPQGRLFLPSLETMAIALQELVILRYLKEQGISNISQELVASAINLIDKSQPAKTNLPLGRFLRRSQQRIFVE